MILSKTKKRKKSVLLALERYIPEIALGVARYAHETDWILDDNASHGGVIPPGWFGDGAITLLQSARTPLAGLIQRARIPVVNLCNEDPNLRFPKVLPDNEGIGEIAARELLGRGITQFAFFAVNRNANVVLERMSGFRHAVESAGGSFHMLDFTEKWRKPRAAIRMIPWLGAELTRIPRPVGAMAQHDGEAVHIVRACLNVGLRVPEDVAIVGVDNDPIYSQLGPIPLTSVLSNRELLGYRAAELLDRLMRGEKPPKIALRIPAGGIALRRSSDVFATEDLCLSKALRFIALHISEPFDVEHVVAASGASRRALYRKFDSHLHHSIATEILRQRLNLAKKLLSTTELKQHAIAAECGFQSAVSLSKAFKSHEGIPPSAYRENHLQMK